MRARQASRTLRPVSRQASVKVRRKGEAQRRIAEGEESSEGAEAEGAKEEGRKEAKSGAKERGKREAPRLL